jgi:hypothetical protein
MYIQDTMLVQGATVRVHVERAYKYDRERGLWLYRQEDEDVEAHNLVTYAGRDLMHLQCYGTTGLSANGFNYIALTNDSGAPAVTDTTLASELTNSSAPGLGRTQGAYAHTSNTNTTTIANTFTYTGVSSQGVQKTALFDASTSGVMNHEISFTSRTLFTNDTITLTFTIQVG